MFRLRMRRLLKLAAGIAAALALGGFLVAWLGLYNVAANRDHWRIVEWMLAFGMRHSVDVRAARIDPPALDDANMIRLGAAHFHAGCAYCHGAPGVPITPIARAMLPSPPDLSALADKWDDRELFWIIRNGLKYTGMPAWPGAGRDDEVWSVVAFMRRLHDLDAPAYTRLALGNLKQGEPDGREIATADADLAGACARCHGADGEGPSGTLVPILHGQSEAFLLDAMRAYAEGRRPSGFMATAAGRLSDTAIRRVAAYYAGLPALRSAASPADAETIERGRRLAEEGAPAARVPACTGCHGPNALAAYPRLAGQHAAYMAGQLRLWRSGTIPDTPTGAIMGPIAQKLTDRQIEDVVAYFASRKP